MAWELKNVEEQRLALIEAYISGRSTMVELCKEYGISRKTGYKWHDRYLSHGQEGPMVHLCASESLCLCVAYQSLLTWLPKIRF